MVTPSEIRRRRVHRSKIPKPESRSLRHGPDMPGGGIFRRIAADLMRQASAGYSRGSARADRPGTRPSPPVPPDRKGPAAVCEAFCFRQILRAENSSESVPYPRRTADQFWMCTAWPVALTAAGEVPSAAVAPLVPVVPDEPAVPSLPGPPAVPRLPEPPSEPVVVPSAFCL